MGRRSFLRGVAAAASVGIAGCSAFQTESGGVTETYQPTAGDHLALAVEQLNLAALAVEEFQAADDPQTATFDVTAPRNRIDRAREAIAAAEKEADGGTLSTVRTVEAYATTIEGTVTAVEQVTTAGDTLVSARDELGAETVETQAADDALERAKTASNKAVEAHDNAATALSEADADRLRDVGAQVEPLNNGLDTLAGFVTGVDALTAGYDQVVTGITRLQMAQDHVEGEQFDDARESFVSAREAFAAAAPLFQNAIDSAADSLVSDLRGGDERSRALERLAAGYVALLDGQDRVRDAETALNEGNDDEARNALNDGQDAATTALNRFEEGRKIRQDAFATQFDTARDRARSLDKLTAGYLRLLDGQDRVRDAETALEKGNDDEARNALNDGQDAAAAAQNRFEEGRAIRGDEFATQFDTARNRAQSLDALAAGYLRLLDSQADFTQAKERFEESEFDATRTALDAASADATAADERFADGAETADPVFEESFSTGRRRAESMNALAQGYGRLVAAREHLDDGESAVRDENYTDAKTAFDNAETASGDAERIFESGSGKPETAVFTEEFDAALQRARGLDALAAGYTKVVLGRERAGAGIDRFEAREFGPAETQFRAANDRFGEAESTFIQGKNQTGDAFATAFDRALCRVTRLQTAMDHFVKAATAGSNRNRGTARDQFEKGQAALDRVETC
jgi:uncharacterized phage infection (PIP) family protein YhgE